MWRRTDGKHRSGNFLGDGNGAKGLVDGPIELGLVVLELLHQGRGDLRREELGESEKLGEGEGL